MGIRNHCLVEICPFCGQPDNYDAEELLRKIEEMLIENNSFNMQRTKAELIKALVYSDYDMFDIMLKAFQEVRSE